MFLVETCNPTGEDSQNGRRSDLAYGENVSKHFSWVALLLYADGTIHHDSLTLYRGVRRSDLGLSGTFQPGSFLELKVTKNSEKGTRTVTRIL